MTIVNEMYRKQVPQTKFKCRVDSKWHEATADDYFKNKTECTDSKYISTINQRDGEVTETDSLMEKSGLNLNPDGVVGSKTEPEVKSTSTTNNTTTT